MHFTLTSFKAYDFVGSDELNVCVGYNVRVRDAILRNELSNSGYSADVNVTFTAKMCAENRDNTLVYAVDEAKLSYELS